MKRRVEFVDKDTIRVFVDDKDYIDIVPIKFKIGERVFHIYCPKEYEIKCEEKNNYVQIYKE